MIIAEKDICAKGIESSTLYDYALCKEDAENFHEMLDNCYKYSDPINAKPRLISTEPLIMALDYST